MRRLLVALTLVTAAVAGAQQVPDRTAAIEIRKQFVTDMDTLHAKFIALANAFPADKYSWRPAPGVRSVGEVFMHVASEFYVYDPMAYGAPPSPAIKGTSDTAMKKFEATGSKDVVIKNLNDGFAYTKASIMALDPAKLVGKQKLFGTQATIIETGMGMAGDIHEHLGQLIGYARMNGITPPWSK